MKYRHWSGWIILLTVLAGIVGCSRAGQDRKGRNLGVYEAFMREMEDSLTKDLPEYTTGWTVHWLRLRTA